MKSSRIRVRWSIEARRRPRALSGHEGDVIFEVRGVGREGASSASNVSISHRRRGPDELAGGDRAEHLTGGAVGLGEAIAVEQQAGALAR